MTDYGDIENSALFICSDCGGTGYIVEPEHHHLCDPNSGCVVGCPVPVQVECEECNGSGQTEGHWEKNKEKK